jgi:surfactin synthase thioesterase subunit/acyl carrier protein
VVQSAGVLDDGILAQLDWDRFARLFEPRVYGSWLLHEYTKSLELDFFVLKSSLWSLLGSAGQGNYIASSTFLDSLAAHRRIAGLPATVVNWCAWSGGGLATVSGARGEAMLSSMGMKFVSPDLATQMFDKLMHRDVDQIAIAVADWSTYASKMGKSTFLAELLNRNEDSRTSKSAQGKVALSVPRIAVNGQARQQLLKRLQQHIMARLGFVDEIAPDQPLNEIGLDSLMSVSVSNSLEDEFGIPVPVAELISGPTINQLIDGVFRELWTDKIRVAPAPLSATKFQECVGFSDAESIAFNSDARAKLESVLQRHITAELGFVDPIDPHQPLNEIGLDSSRSVTLANTLKDVFGISVSVKELIWGPTINQLVDHLIDELAAVEVQISGDQYQQMGPQQVNNERASGATPIATAEERNDPQACPALRINEETQLVGRENGVGAEDSRPIVRLSSETELPTAPKWLSAPRPNPVAKARLFCFPYAGGGLVSFRSWPQLLGESVEMVAVEPPGRGTRINEAPINNIDTFVECLLPEMIEWLDRPSAFFGHCLGGLTMFATLCALPKGSMRFIKHVFACAVRPPHLLKRRGEFEDNLVYDMMLHKEFDIRVPPYAQADEIFVDIVRHFDTPEADKMLAIPALRAALLPTIRAEFGMAYNYKYEAVQPFTFPISSFVGDIDPWVSEKDSAGWGKLTCGSFTNHVRKGSHFLMAEDREYILETINNEFVNLATQ